MSDIKRKIVDVIDVGDEETYSSKKEMNIPYKRNLSIEEFEESEQFHLNDLICCLCKGVFFEPILINSGKCFCKGCFFLYNTKLNKKDGNESSLICPITFELIEKDKIKNVFILKEKIESFTVKCKNRNNSCEWKGLLKYRNSHLENCLKEEIYCPNVNCETFGFREEIKKHQIDCIFRKENCSYCQLDYLFKEKNKHLDECLFFKITCQNNCGELIERRNIIDHLSNICQNSLIECPLKKFKLCDSEILRKDYKKHFELNILTHFLSIAQLGLKIENKISSEFGKYKDSNNILSESKSQAMSIIPKIEENMNKYKNETNFRMRETSNRISKLEDKLTDLLKKFDAFKEKYEDRSKNLNCIAKEYENKIINIKEQN